MRSVFIPKKTKPYYSVVPVEFAYVPGLAPSCKMENVKSLHEGYLKKHPDDRILEVSTKGDEGAVLSPFHLTRTLATLHKAFPVENIYLASQVKESGGPYYDLLGGSPLAARRDPRTKGETVLYELEGRRYPARPDLLFYNWVYCMALMENGYGPLVLRHDAFTDIEFSGKDGNCQARACAIAHSLLMAGKLRRNMSFEEFSRLWLVEDVAVPEKKPLKMSMAEKPVRTVFSVGDWLEHPSIGTGEVMKRTSKDYTIMFRVSGPRTLRKDIVETICRKLYIR